MNLLLASRPPCLEIGSVLTTPVSILKLHECLKFNSALFNLLLPNHIRPMLPLHFHQIAKVLCMVFKLEPTLERCIVVVECVE